MKTKHLNRTLAVVTVGFFLIYTLPLFPSIAFADHKDSHNPQGNGNGNGNGNQVGNSGNSEKNVCRGLDRAELVRANAEKSLSKHVGGKDFHAKRPGDYGQRELPTQVAETAVNSLSKRSDSGREPDAARLLEENRRIVEDLQRVIGKLKEHGKGKENARWDFNPKDDRGQGNMAKVDMLDPYGHSKDDRMELYGNRGRPIREEEILTFLYGHYIWFGPDTYTYWYQSYLNGWTTNLDLITLPLS